MSRTLALALLVVAGVAPAQNQADLDRLKADLDARKAAYDKARAAAHQTALRAFDDAIQKVKKSNTSATNRVSLVEQLTGDKEQFIQSGRWPANGNLIKPALDYTQRLNKHHKPVAKAYEQLIDVYLKTNREEEAKTLTREKVQLDKDLPGRDKLTDGSRWHGTWNRAKGTVVPIHLNVKKVTGTVFEAEVHENPGVAGHPIFEVRGVIDGIHITKCQTSRVVRGRPRLTSFEGYIIGDKMLMGVGEVSPKGVPSLSRVWLERH